MADIVAAAPQHAVTVIRTAEKKLLLNPNLLTPTTFDRLLVSTIDTGTHEAAKAFCWNIFNATDTLYRDMSRMHGLKEIINIGEAAMTLASRTNAIGFPRVTDALVRIYKHSVECHTSTTPFPQPPKADKVEDNDVVMKDPAPAVVAPVVVPTPVAVVPAVVVPKDEEAANGSDEEEEEVIKKPTKRRAPPAKKAAPAKKGGRKAKKVESSDEEFAVEENEEQSDFEEEAIPDDPLKEEKIAFRAQHVLDLVEIKRLVEEFKAEAELTEKYMLKFFEETPWEAEDKPSQKQTDEFKKVEATAKAKEATANATKAKDDTAKSKAKK